jgi:hypothetical protein
MSLSQSHAKQSQLLGIQKSENKTRTTKKKSIHPTETYHKEYVHANEASFEYIPAKVIEENEDN